MKESHLSFVSYHLSVAISDLAGKRYLPIRGYLKSRQILTTNNATDDHECK
jgi:hypothetical protein